MNNLLKSIAVILSLTLPSVAMAQSTMLQSGATTQAHIPQYVNSTNGSQVTVKDGGGAGGGIIGTNPSEIGLAVRNPNGTYPAANAGSGPLYSNFCNYDAPTNNPTGYHYLCMSANAQGGGLIAYGAGGGATTLPFQFYINGVPYSIGGVSNSIVVGSTAITGATNGQILYNNNGALGAETVVPAANVVIASGSAPTATGSCAINSWVGGNTAGRFLGTATCTASSLILTFATTAPNGWACFAVDQNHPADTVLQTAVSVNSATFQATWATSDVVQVACTAY